MATSAERKSIPPTPKEDEVSFEVTPLGSELVKLLTESDYVLLQKIAVAIGKDGMTVEEACILTNVEYDHIQELAKKHPVILKVIRLKELEYKRSLLKTISHRARNGDDDVAMWLLETRYPEEFAKKKSNSTTPGDSLKDAITFIQEQGDSDGIIQRKSVIISGPNSHAFKPKENSMIKKIQGFLS